MREPGSVEREHLYQSQWWVRLAAFSEKREREEPARVNQREKERAGVGKKLASLFRGLQSHQERGEASFLTPS